MTEPLRPFADPSIAVPQPPALAPGVVEGARNLGTASLHEAAGKIGALPSAIRAAAPGFRLCGPAFTVHGPGGDNLWLHRALSAARPGDILVAYVSGWHEAGYWGDIMSNAAVAAQLGGLVIDGCVRDSAVLPSVGFPIFARGFCIRGTDKDFGARGWLNQPVLLGDVVVQPGDLIVADEDGVVSIPRLQAESVIQKAAERDAAEAVILRRLKDGERSLDIYGWNR